jgi:hypothetical protein
MSKLQTLNRVRAQRGATEEWVAFFWHDIKALYNSSSQNAKICSKLTLCPSTEIHLLNDRQTIFLEFTHRWKPPKPPLYLVSRFSVAFQLLFNLFLLTTFDRQSSPANMEFPLTFRLSLSNSKSPYCNVVESAIALL